MAKDASIEIVQEVNIHPNADRLDLAKVLGFQCVTQKGLYQGGEKIVYIRPDAVLPQTEWAQSYRVHSPDRIRAVQLRSKWSEGIIVPFNLLPGETCQAIESLPVGTDVSALLGITHWEAPAPQDPHAKSSVLPFGIRKTEETRFEEISNELPYGQIVDIQLKIDGTSTTYYYKIDTKEFGVLAREQEMKLEIENKYTDPIKKYDIQNKLTQFCEQNQISLALRGELYGTGILSSKNNPHSKLEKDWAMFAVYLIDSREYANKGHQYYFKTVASLLQLPIASMIEENVILTPEIVNQYSSDLKKLNDQPFEGVVVKHANGSFKIINKDYDSRK